MNESTTNAENANDNRRLGTLKVTTGARLHFGLLDALPPFGGVGVMIDRPATEIVVQEGDVFRCDDDPEGRIESIARRVAQASGAAEPPACRVTILTRPDAHSGLGTGTQLAMAAAEALCRWVDHPFDHFSLAREIADRGERSAVGIHGYFFGGLIYESGQHSGKLNPIVQRVALPADWCVALFRPPHSVATVSGHHEREHFAQLTDTNEDVRQRLDGIASERLLPAAQQGDFSAFTSAVASYNHQSGLLFAPVQGGAYNGRSVTALVETLVDRGATGVGQSSWGPTVFAWFESYRQANEFGGELPAQIPRPMLARPLNQNRSLRED